jgi:hypothetical protein
VNQTCLSGAATRHFWYLQYFNLKTAGITSGILDFGAPCIVSFLGLRTKEAGNSFTFISPLTNPNKRQ